jgi:hypothetical protein
MDDRCGCGRPRKEGSYVCGICEQQSRSDASRRADFKFWVEVVYCPDGTYQRGSRFSAAEFNLAHGKRRLFPTTIDLGYWVPGMVVRDWRGRVWVVEGTQLRPQRILPVGDLVAAGRTA